VSILCEYISAVLAGAAADDPNLDWLDVSWQELDKRALERQTRLGRMVRIILPANQRLEHGAVLARDGLHQIVINVIPCESLMIESQSAAELAHAAYVAGNLHLPAQIEDGRIILPADPATQAALDSRGISYRVQVRRIRPIPDILPRVTIAGGLSPLNP
jgi:urease accessory protein